MGRLCVPLLLLLAAAVAVTAVATNAKSSPPRVVGFWLVDVATGAWRRRLTDGASIGEPPGTYTIAALSSAGRRLPVVFVEPASYARTERVAPYVAAGKEARSVQGMTLPVGAATVSAYVAGGGERPPLPTTSVRLVIAGATPAPCATAPAGTPPPAPMPTAPPAPDGRCGSPWPTPVTTLTPAATAPPPDAEDDMSPPPMRSGCPLPVIENVYGDTARGGPEPWYLWIAAAASCAGAPVRVQVFATAEDGVSAPWRVSQFLFTPMSSSSELVTPRPGSYLEQAWEASRRCGSPAVFATLCVAGEAGWPVCARSPDVRMLAARPPVVAYRTRPPWVLALAPGDAAAVVRSTVGSPVGLVMVAVARASDGTLCRSRPTTSRELRVDVAALTGSGGGVDGGGVPLSANGSVVWMEYSAPGCTRTVGSTAAVANTTLLVSTDVDPLVVQDARPPANVALTYPPSRRGSPVQLTVAYVNAGGGRRRGRATGELRPAAPHFQWLVLTDTAPGEPDTPRALGGEVGPTLSLPSAVGAGQSCNRGGCTGLLGYLVDVCNTAGCTRSALVAPVIVDK